MTNDQFLIELANASKFLKLEWHTTAGALIRAPLPKHAQEDFPLSQLEKIDESLNGWMTNDTIIFTHCCPITAVFLFAKQERISTVSWKAAAGQIGLTYPQGYLITRAADQLKPYDTFLGAFRRRMLETLKPFWMKGEEFL